MLVAALPRMSVSGMVTEWSVQPVAIACVVVAGGWYLRRVRDAALRWSPWRTVAWCIGLGLFAWTTNGVLEAYTRSLLWVQTTQLLALLLVVPVVLMAGQPVALARCSTGERSVLVRLTRSRLGRVLNHPLIGPALVPILAAVLFFGPLPGWQAAWPPGAWLLQAAVVGLGCLIVLPLVGSDVERSSLAVGAALAIGVLELLMDAIPGIVLRLQSSISSTFFQHRAPQAWSPIPLHDQQLAGGVLWAVAELLDLPFLFILLVVWVQADARDARQIDTALDAERTPHTIDVDAGHGRADPPWWLIDPATQQRPRRPQ